MKKYKRIIAVVLCFALCLGMSVCAFAAPMDGEKASAAKAAIKTASEEALGAVRIVKEKEEEKRSERRAELEKLAEEAVRGIQILPAKASKNPPAIKPVVGPVTDNPPQPGKIIPPSKDKGDEPISHDFIPNEDYVNDMLEIKEVGLRQGNFVFVEKDAYDYGSDFYLKGSQIGDLGFGAVKTFMIQMKDKTGMPISLSGEMEVVIPNADFARGAELVLLKSTDIISGQAYRPYEVVDFTYDEETNSVKFNEKEFGEYVGFESIASDGWKMLSVPEGFHDLTWMAEGANISVNNGKVRIAGNGSGIVTATAGDVVLKWGITFREQILSMPDEYKMKPGETFQMSLEDNRPLVGMSVEIKDVSTGESTDGLTITPIGIISDSEYGLINAEQWGLITAVKAGIYQVKINISDECSSFSRVYFITVSE